MLGLLEGIVSRTENPSNFDNWGVDTKSQLMTTEWDGESAEFTKSGWDFGLRRPYSLKITVFHFRKLGYSCSS